MFFFQKNTLVNNTYIMKKLNVIYVHTKIMSREKIVSKNPVSFSNKFHLLPKNFENLGKFT